LNQWRAYGGDVGVAIGLRADHLVEMARRIDAHIGPIIYDVEHQQAIATALVDEFFERCDPTQSSGNVFD
jgi:hypothetical protein